MRAALGRRRSTCGLALALLLVALWSPAPAQATPGTEDPPLRTAGGIARTLSCTSPFDDDREPVLLVPGLTADQNIDFGWNYRPELIARGFDVCSIDLPAEGFGDVTISGEYLVGAVRYLYEHANHYLGRGAKEFLELVATA